MSATGAVLPEREVALSFSNAGTISAVKAEVGQAIKAGDVLATLDTMDLELAEKQAQVGIQQAQAQLQQLQESAGAADVTAAEAALASAQQGLKSAQAAYQQTLQGPDKDTLAAAQAQVAQALVQLQQAQQAYDKVKDRPDVGLMPQSIQLQNASIALETAQAQYRAAEKSVTSAQVAAARSQVTAAEAQVAQAQASLDRLKRGASQGQLAAARAGVDQAMLSLQVAQRRVENARILAPWDGIITQVAIVPGAQAAPAQPALKLADVSKFHLDVQVDEVDIAVIEPGQPVQVEIDALPDEKLTGTVSRISPAATTSTTGNVSYNVRLDIDSNECAPQGRHERDRHDHREHPSKCPAGAQSRGTVGARDGEDFRGAGDRRGPRADRSAAWTPGRASQRSTRGRVGGRNPGDSEPLESGATPQPCSAVDEEIGS